MYTRQIRTLSKSIAFAVAVTIIFTLIPAKVCSLTDDNFYVQSDSAMQTDTQIIEAEKEMSANADVDALYEETDLRTPNSKTLRLSDGTKKVGTYGFSVHFETLEGFCEYDNTLKLSGDKYVPSNSDIELEFMKNKPSYTLEFDKTCIGFELLNTEFSTAEAVVYTLPEQKYGTKTDELFCVPKVKAQLEYTASSGGIRFSYLIYGRNIKECIVLEKLPEKCSFEFFMTTDETAYIDDEGSVHIVARLSLEGICTIPSAHQVVW